MSARDPRTRPPRPPRSPAPAAGKSSGGGRAGGGPRNSGGAGGGGPRNRGAKASASSQKAALTSGGRVVGSNRDWRLFVFFCFASVILIGQLVYLQVFAAPDLRAEAHAQRTSEVAVPARRGAIYDRDGNVLAMSVDAVTIYANPRQVADPFATAAVLADVLGGSPDDYYGRLTEDTTFVYILQKADMELAEQLKERDRSLRKELEEKAEAAAAAGTAGAGTAAEAPVSALHGIDYLTDTKRVYPYGSIGAQVIGMVDVDNKGIFGLEQMYDSVLRGTDGKLSTEYSLAMEQRPLSGQPIPGSEREEVAPVHGQDIVLSLDIELQQYLEAELVRMGTERATEEGNALVLDGATGEIYASASLPLLDRDNITAEAIEKGATTLKSVCLSYEPGSIFKSLTAAAALEAHVMDVEEEIAVPATRVYEEYTVSDSHERFDTVMSFRTILAQSSNVGISLVKDRLDDESYYGYLRRFGVKEATHVDFPGEALGSLDPWESWSAVQAANISFGQGVSLTSLQAADFYGAVVNDGLKYRPHFLIDRPQAPLGAKDAIKGEQVMRTDTAQALRSMLASAVSEGTGHAAAIEGYEVAGKTGTAQKASPDGGYLPDEYIVSFVGFLVGSQSKLVCITSMDNPIGAEGNAPTGPLFASIMQFAANRYMIEPGTVGQPQQPQQP